jgi:hypothetical protein
MEEENANGGGLVGEISQPFACFFSNNNRFLVWVGLAVGSIARSLTHSRLPCHVAAGSKNCCPNWKTFYFYIYVYLRHTQSKNVKLFVPADPISLFFLSLSTPPPSPFFLPACLFIALERANSTNQINASAKQFLIHVILSKGRRKNVEEEIEALPKTDKTQKGKGK